MLGQLYHREGIKVLLLYIQAVALCGPRGLMDKASDFQVRVLVGSCHVLFITQGLLLEKKLTN